MRMLDITDLGQPEPLAREVPRSVGSNRRYRRPRCRPVERRRLFEWCLFIIGSDVEGCGQRKVAEQSE